MNRPFRLLFSLNYLNVSTKLLRFTNAKEKIFGARITKDLYQCSKQKVDLLFIASAAFLRSWTRCGLR